MKIHGTVFWSFRTSGTSVRSDQVDRAVSQLGTRKPLSAFKSRDNGGDGTKKTTVVELDQAQRLRNPPGWTGMAKNKSE